MANFFSKIGEFLMGKKPGVQQYDLFNPQQQQVQNGINQNLQGGNQNAFDWLNSILSDEEGAFEDYEAPYKEQFEQETIPMLMEKFGGLGAKNSSAFNQTLARAGRGFSKDLASQRANLKQNAVQMLQNYGNQGLQQSKGQYMQGGTEGLIGMLSKFAGPLGKLLGG